jgi:plasmid stability protein
MYDSHMRTTISLDDRLGQAVRRRAAEEGTSVSAFIAAVLDDALKRSKPQKKQAFRLVTVGGTGVRRGIDLDRPRQLEVDEDVALWQR